jgi:hypothetical protein
VLTADALDHAPDLLEPFRAWRVWRVTKDLYRAALASVSRPIIWPAGEPLVAECMRHRSRLATFLRPGATHIAPALHCACGIYATDLDHALDYLMQDAFPFELATVLGSVALWGEVVECEVGYRASHAYPVALYIAETHRGPDWGPNGAIVLDLQGYGVPVEMLPSGRSLDESIARLSA